MSTVIAKKVPRSIKGRSPTLCAVLLSYAVASGGSLFAQEAPMIDCPLRDAPFTADLPLIDVLLSPAASELLAREVPGLLDLPPHLLKTEAPSFGSIMTVRQMALMRQTPFEEIERLEGKLATLEVTQADRHARCERYDNIRPELEVSDGGVNILVFDKINGFDHGPSVAAATDAIKSLADELGWTLAVTNRGGAFVPESLARFDAVVWNNVSGDVLTLTQREAFRDYIDQGGGFVGIHGSGGDSIYFWEWYSDTLLGARFIGHPSDPQFQDAQLHIDETPSGIGKDLAPGWTMNDEWYSFRDSPRLLGASIVARLDEDSYTPVGWGGQDLRMGEDHPIVWTRCVGDGRMLYSAIGHRPEVYEIVENMALLKDGLVWAAGQGKTACTAGEQTGR